uniref:Uncharacterized protein n=1 Tax=Arundo donax TaxID=35708 RepID=A0A0A8ZED7_ARUDO
MKLKKRDNKAVSYIRYHLVQYPRLRNHVILALGCIIRHYYSQHVYKINYLMYLRNNTTVLCIGGVVSRY